MKVSYTENLTPPIAQQFIDHFSGSGDIPPAMDSEDVQREQSSQDEGQEFLAIAVEAETEPPTRPAVIVPRRQQQPLIVAQPIPRTLQQFLPSEGTLFAFAASFSLNSGLVEKLPPKLDKLGATFDEVFAGEPQRKKIKNRLIKTNIDLSDWHAVTSALYLPEIRVVADWTIRQLTGTASLSLSHAHYKRVVTNPRNDLSHGRDVSEEAANSMMEEAAEIIQLMIETGLTTHH